jgi:molybdopterin molybdotransferase
MQGITEIWVKQQPRITLLNTGTELVDTTDGENSHSFNALMLAELINKYGGVCHDQQILPDKTDILLKEISRASKNCDLLVITGGSGDGIHDVTKKILKKLATQVLIQHPAIHPASSFGAFVVNKCPVLHFPGTPAAAHLCSEVFLRPLIASFLQLDDPLWHLIHLESKIVSKLGKTTFHPLRLLRKNDRFSAVILDKQQGFYQQLLTMDGYLRIPAEVTDANIGEIHPII